MTLDNEQISHIKSFIHSRGFETIEVEAEILDHVASAVEEKLAKDTSLNFEEAVSLVHQSFGVMGFSIFEDNIISSLGKQMNHTYLKTLRHTVTSRVLIKVVLTALFTFASLILFANTLEPGIFKIAAYLLLAIIGAIPVISHQKLFKAWGKKSLILGKLLWPFIFGSVCTAYLVQILPESFINTASTSFIIVMAGTSLLLSLGVWTTLNFIDEVYAWTSEKWLKYA